MASGAKLQMHKKHQAVDGTTMPFSSGMHRLPLPMTSSGVDATSSLCLASSGQVMEQLSAALLALSSRVLAGNLAIDIISYQWRAEAVRGGSRGVGHHCQ
jgi:hypothetical protein